MHPDTPTKIAREISSHLDFERVELVFLDPTFNGGFELFYSRGAALDLDEVRLDVNRGQADADVKLLLQITPLLGDQPMVFRWHFNLCKTQGSERLHRFTNTVAPQGELSLGCNNMESIRATELGASSSNLLEK